MKKKLLCVLLGISMIGTMPGFMANAEEPATEAERILTGKYEKQHREVRNPVYREAATSFAGGDGSEESPYEISSAEELQYLSDLLSDEENRSSEYRNQHYILTSDISLNDTSDYAGWSEAGPEYDWRPIGVAAAFGGVFDGNGHTISGLYINADMEDDNTADARKNGGLFAQIFGGTVKNLNLTEVYIEVSGDALDTGAIAGSASKAEISDCTVDGLVIGYEYYTGGLVGNASGTIRGCEFDGIVRAAKDLDNDQAGQAYIGGIVGSFSSVPTVGDEEETGAFEGITDCVNRGNVEVLKGSASANAAGGIAGTNSAKITNCVNEGTVAANAGGQTEEKGTGILIGWRNCRNLQRLWHRRRRCDQRLQEYRNGHGGCGKCRRNCRRGVSGRSEIPGDDRALPERGDRICGKSLLCRNRSGCRNQGRQYVCDYGLYE